MLWRCDSETKLKLKVTGKLQRKSDGDKNETKTKKN